MPRRSLDDYLNLTDEQARSQWARIESRQPKKRQEPYTPVEVILCYALLFVVDPRRYGGQNIRRAPAIVHRLAKRFVRPAGSLTNKMLNLDGSRPNAAKFDRRFSGELATNPSLFPPLYHRVLSTARKIGSRRGEVPDFLGLAGKSGFELLGQEELLRQRELLRQEGLDDVAGEQTTRHTRAESKDLDTARLVEQKVRVGQHLFAAAVLDNYAYTCAFCGFAPRSLPNRRLLVASHIKPWSKSSDRERRDPTNGVAACPTHDAAFDTGLITISPELGVYRAPSLTKSLINDPLVESYFGAALSSTLVVPDAGKPPDLAYLAWHREYVYRGNCTG